MKLKLSSMLTATALTIASLASMGEATIAGSSDKYFCGTSSDGVPTTFARDVIGRRIAIIRWQKAWGGAFTPQKRCELVSANFQQAFEDGALEFVGVGTHNGYNVVCAMKEPDFPQFTSDAKKTDCTHHLFTLRTGVDGNKVVESLLDIGSTAGAPLVQANSWDIYKLGAFFRETPKN